MKILQLVVMVVFILTATATIMPASAQAWIPRNGYWEVITHVDSPKRATVRYYDLERHLLYEERVEGVELDLHSRRTCRWLNKRLQTVLAAWVTRK